MLQEVECIAVCDPSVANYPLSLTGSVMELALLRRLRILALEGTGVDGKSLVFLKELTSLKSLVRFFGFASLLWGSGRCETRLRE